MIVIVGLVYDWVVEREGSGDERLCGGLVDERSERLERPLDALITGREEGGLGERGGGKWK